MNIKEELTWLYDNESSRASEIGGTPEDYRNIQQEWDKRMLEIIEHFSDEEMVHILAPVGSYITPPNVKVDVNQYQLKQIKETLRLVSNWREDLNLTETALDRSIKKSLELI